MSDQLAERRRQLHLDPKNTSVLLDIVQELKRLGKDAEAYVTLFRYGQSLDDAMAQSISARLTPSQGPALQTFQLPGECFSAGIKDGCTPYVFQKDLDYTEDYFRWCWEDLAEFSHRPRPLLALDLRENAVTDSDLQILPKLSTLQSLRLSGCHGLSDEAIIALRELPFLRVLSLGDCSGLTAQSLPHVASCKELRCLSIDGWDIDDDGLKSLCDLDQLQSLSLNMCQGLTNACLDDLKRLTGLRILEVSMTQLDIESLRTALPKVEVFSD